MAFQIKWKFITLQESGELKSEQLCIGLEMNKYLFAKAVTMKFLQAPKMETLYVTFRKPKCMQFIESDVSLETL